MHSLDAEIFAAGTWNKTWKFTSKDLRDIVANFDALADNHKVPLKFGHNEQQPFTDGQPALGWVTKVWVNDDDKLMARFDHVPTVVKKAFDAKLYRHVSVELDVDVEHRGKKYKYVLSAVALLGADIPAVNTLKDLTSYLDGGERLAASRREVFSAIQGDLSINQQEDIMSEEIMKKLDALTAKFSQLSDEQAKTTAENAALKAKIGQLESEKAEAAKLEATGKVKMHRESLVGKLEAAVKDHRLTPAQREGAIKFMRLNDDEAAQKVTAEQVDEYITINGGKAKMSTEQGRGQGTGGKDDADGKTYEDAGAEIVARANKLRGEDAKLSFSAARDRVLEADPELAKKWLLDEQAA